MAFDGLRRQLRSVIEWKGSDDNDLVYCWSDNGDEIKNSSKLIVGPGQGCVFVYKGQIKEVITKEGIYNLQTENIPFWTTISRVLQFFESEHKTGFYFYRRTKVVDQKWGTSSPIKYTDPKYKFPVGLKAYGNYSFLVNDPKVFFTTIVGDKRSYYVNDISEVMKNRLVQPFVDLMAESKYSYAELDANLDEISAEMTQKLIADFDKLGLTIVDYRVEGTDFDEDTKTRINRIADIRADVQAAEAAGISYQELQRIEAMRDAAQNEGGGAGVGMSMGAGIGLGEVMAGNVNASVNSAKEPTPQAVPEPKAEPSSEERVMARLKKLKMLFAEDLISEEEFKAKKADILKDL